MKPIRGRLLLCLGILLALTLLLGACQSATPTPAPTPTPTATPSPTPAPTPTPTLAATPTPVSTATPTPSGLSGVLSSVVQAASKIKTMHFMMDMTVKGTPAAGGTQSTLTDMQFTGDIVMPDSLQGTMTVTVQGHTISSDIVVIGKDGYLKNPLTGQWMKTSVSQVAMFIDPRQLVSDVASGAVNVALVGQDTVDGFLCDHYQGMPSAAALADMQMGWANISSATVGLWVDTQSSLPRKSTLSVTGTTDQQPLSGQVLNVDLSVNLSDFDKPVTIVPPI